MRGFRAEAAQLGADLRDGRLAILCGAGISAPPPSSLPLAARLIEQILAQLLDPYHDRLPGLAMRPEMLFSYLFRQDPRATLAAVSRAVTGRAYNPLHDLCAQVIAARGAVITTNFDMLIEAALAARDAPFTSSTSACAGAEAVLFKIHGSIDDPASIAVTIDHVGAGLSAARERSLAELVRDRTVLVLGYSGKDELDIVPALARTSYRRVVWIDHGPGRRPRRKRRPPEHLRLLPRVAFWTGQTLDSVAGLAPLPLISGPAAAAGVGTRRARALSDARKRSAALDILMHENRYAEMVAFIDALALSDDLHMRIARFEASSSISTRSAAWTVERDELLDRLFAASKRVQREFLPTMAKYNHRADRLLLLREIELQALAGLGPTDQQIEAAVETLYELVYNHFLDDARELADTICTALDRRPNLVLRGRLLIEQAYLAGQTFALTTADPALLAEGLTACEEAIYLFGPDICNDGFFCAQARSNKGWLHVMCGEFGAGERELKRARRYFRGVSFNNYLTQWLLLAVLRRAEGRFGEARRLLGAFRRINRKSGRTYWLGFANREDALCAAALGVGDRRVRSLLGAATACFEAEENAAEAELTRMLEQRLLASPGPRPRNIFTAPPGRI